MIISALAHHGVIHRGSHRVLQNTSKVVSDGRTFYHWAQAVDTLGQSKYNS
jgi:hypothetical protein